jgi:hypothetical protein
MKVMQKLTVTIYGKVTYAASRTFEIEVPDDENIQLLNIDTLNDLADEAKVAWTFGEEGHIEPQVHEVESR